MGLLIRVYDIESPNNFDLSIGLSPYGPFTPLNNPNTANGSWPSSNARNYRDYPIYIGDNDPLITNGTPQPSEIVFHDIEFDTQYWLKLEDNVNVISVCDGDNTPRYIVENIYINDSKTFECYDRISFEVVYDPDTCPTPTPYPTLEITAPPTATPFATPNPTPTQFPTATPQSTVQPSPTPTPTILINTETEINIFFDSSGSMNTTLSPLVNMRDNILQNCLLPFYNNDVSLYNQRVTITNKSDERAIQWIATPPSNPSYNVVNLAFADESNNRYEAERITVSGWTDGSVSGDADIAQLRDELDNATTPTSHRGIIFQVDTLSGGQDIYPQYQNFINAVFNGLGYYAGTSGLSDKNEVSGVQDVIAGSTPQYYADLIVNAMNNLGYNVPSC